MQQPTADAESPKISSERSSRGLFARLSVMMVLQYWPLGLWFVTIATFIGEHTGPDQVFSPGFLGYSASAIALGSFATPTLFGWLADRYFAAERLLSVLHLGAAFSLFWMYEATTQTSFYIGMVLCFQCYGPTVALSNTIAMRKLVDNHHEFPVVRLYGTVAWIAAGLFIGIVAPWWAGASIEATRTPFYLAAFSHVVMVFYSLSLPHTPPGEHRSSSKTVSRESKGKLYRNRAFVLFLTVSLLAAIPSQFYNFSNLFLNRMGYAGAAATLTLGQVSEVICLAMMPLLLRHLRLKTLFLIGLLCWPLRYVLLAAGAAGGTSVMASLPVYLAIMIHGPAYVFVYLAGQMYVDRLVDPSNRGTAQGLHSLAMGGIGHLLGAGLTGWAQSVFLTPNGVTPPPYNWGSFWMAPLGLGIVVAVVFAIATRDRPKGDPPEPVMTAPIAPP